MAPRKIATALLATLFAAGTASAAPADTPRLLTPIDRAVVHGPDVLAVFTTAPKTTVRVRLDGELVELADALVPGDHYDLHHLRVPLAEGGHPVQVVDASTEAELLSFSVTYLPPQSLRTPGGSGARPYAFHSREGEAGCSACHALPETFETVRDQPLAPAGKVCSACHPRVEAAPFLHGPVAVNACFMCHAEDYAPSRFQQRTSQGGLCSNCHESFLAKILGGRKFVHGPVAAGGCTVCHDPHGGRDKALVREDPTELCLACHAETLPVPTARQVHAKVECTRCHNPHGGQTRLFSDAEGPSFCAGCHRNVAESEQGHPIAGHPVEADADPSKPGRRMDCMSCHGPHSVRDISKADILRNEAVQREFCSRCHY